MKHQPLDLSIKLGDYSYQIIQQNFHKIVEQEEAIFEDKDPEPLHQMRVGMRRLRSAIQVFGSAIALPKAVSNPSIGKIAKSLGETRDLDVLQQELISRYQPLLDNTELLKFDKVLKRLQKKRDRSFLNLQKTLNGDRYHDLKQGIQSWLDRPKYNMIGDLSVREVLPDLLLPLICQLFLHRGWLVGTIQSEKVTVISIENSEELHQQLEQFANDLHDLRKQMKGIRYQADFFSGFYGASYLERIEEFKTIQEILGQLHDREVLRQFLESILKADLAKVLPTVNETMQQEQIAFWQIWQPIQQRYLSLEFRQSLRSLLSTPIDIALKTSPVSIDSQFLSSPNVLLSNLQSLRQKVESEGAITFNQWQSGIHRAEFLPSALNLAQYLALRQYDLRDIQSALMPWGLSSLGRIEARVMPNLDAVIAALEVMCGKCSTENFHRQPLESFFEGNRLLHQHTKELFGTASLHRRVRIMVTLPTETATDYELVREIIRRGANSVRINCAHDNSEMWESMIAHVRRAAQENGTSCKVMMDLAGPKIRTGKVFKPPDKKRVFQGDRILLSRCLPKSESKLEIVEAIASPVDNFQICCTIPEILDLLVVDAPVYIDDGKIRTRVVDPQYRLPNGELGLLLQVTHASPKGVKLLPEKGLNFPKTILSLSPLTAKDLIDLDFVATHADIIGYSFVQQPADIDLLQQELSLRLDGRSPNPAIVAKIETAIAVSNLPELIIHAASKQSFGVMIARGDLAVEIGYQRLTEIQEEILWICEAAHVPVIWATQVLESLVKDGAPSRGEMTDAAMAERAECVMLNKGPFIAEAITILDDVLTRMEAHQSKKTPQLRALHSW